MRRVLIALAGLTLPAALAGPGRAQVASSGLRRVAPSGPTRIPPPRYNLLPLPRRMTARQGAFPITDSTRVVLSDPGHPELRRLAGLWIDLVRRRTGLALSLASDSAGAAAGEGGTIVIRLEATRPADAGRRVGARPPVGAGRERGAGFGVEPDRRDVGDADPEGYVLDVADGSVVLSASRPAGLFYGIQTLRQLLTGPAGSGPTSSSVPGAALEQSSAAARSGDAADRRSAWLLPAVHISDSPRFPYRGMHLDVGRHLFPVSFIERYIDLLASYKMNVFHWHLTEDQGWRIQIRRYPRLTSIGSYRRETVLGKHFDPYVGDGRPYSGFYTQDEVRRIVAYAKERYVTVIPEIEMPGHSMAALAAYPELACTDGPFQVGTVWGVYEDIYCPSERTFRFLEGVLAEVMELFPGPYIHIGGDEAPKRRWKESDEAQALMRREGLADEEELQSWFIRRIEQFLIAHGRRLIGWDEILEGGLAPEATVMSWRGMEGGIEAARQGHDVIMTPTSHVYFDYYQGDPEREPLAIGGYTPLGKVYAFEPVPPRLTPDQARHILGAQGNVWTEYMPTSERVEYMVFPRLLALAEVLWSPREARDWAGFQRRLPAQLERLDRLGVHYRRIREGDSPASR
ncbi:MAG: beta-N-acetylhexosaminidase [Gemmatimonadota bacterium]